MEAVQWDDSLSVGIALIDDQHRAWMARFADMAAAIESRQGPREIARTLGFLVDYTERHFATEEKHMTASGYPDLAEHRQKHDELRGTLDNLVQDFQEEGATHILADYVRNFLGNWFVDHIRGTDQKFAAFLRDRGITLPREP